MACNSIAVATRGWAKLGLRCNDDQKRKTKRSGHDTVHDAKKLEPNFKTEGGN